MSTLDVTTLPDAIIQERSCGIVTVDVRPIDSPSVDSYVATFEFKPLGDKWRTINRTTALRALQMILERDLAYDVPSSSPQEHSCLRKVFSPCFPRTLAITRTDHHIRTVQVGTRLPSQPTITELLRMTTIQLELFGLRTKIDRRPVVSRAFGPLK